MAKQLVTLVAGKECMTTLEQTVSTQRPAYRRIPWRERLGPLGRSRLALAALAPVLFWVIVALFADDCLISPACWAAPNRYEGAPWLARYSPYEQFRGQVRRPPSPEHWLGTDSRGRDIWARLAHGSRPILTLAPIAVAIALVIGGALGLLSGYYGGGVDEVIMRVLDALIAFPQILLYLVIIAALGASAFNVVLAITIAGVPGIARLIRGLTLDLKTRDYVAAARTRGESAWHIMLVEILPNVREPIIVDATLRVGYAVFAIGTLGFLGLGLPPPSPDWGSIVQAGRSGILAGHPWPALWASLAIASLVVSLNLIADGIAEESRRYR